MPTAATYDVHELVVEYLDWGEHRRGLRPLTIRMYRNTLKHWCEYLADTPLEDVQPELIEEFCHRPRRNLPKPAMATARRDMVTVKKFMDWCVSRKRIQCFGQLTAVAPKVNKGTPKPIADEVWRQVWNSADVFPDDRLWLGLGYFCGFRRIEMVTIAPEEVLVEQKIMQFQRKGGNHETVDYLAMAASIADTLPWVAEGWEDWMELLESTATQRLGQKHLSIYSSADDAFLDGNRMSKHLGRTVLSNLGLPSDLFTLHQLRHSCATNLFRAGWPAEVVQKAMSHSSFDITKGYMDVAGHMRRTLTERGAL